MQSAQSKIARSVRLPAPVLRNVARAVRPAVVSPLFPLAARRSLVDIAASAGVAVPSAISDVTVGGVPGEWLTPRGVESGAVLLYLHGGGFTYGSPHSHRNLAARLAARMGSEAFVPAYRLAPEHPAPAALDDALAAYRGLLDNGFDPAEIVVAGDSGGAGIALALVSALRDNLEPLPASLGLFSPWLDLTPDISGTRRSVGSDPVLDTKALQSWARAYLGNAEAADPDVSPLLGDLSGLPPTVVHSASDDTVRADAHQFVARASAAGVEVEHVHFDGLWHGFHVHAGVIAAADTALDQAGDALRSLAGIGKSRLRVAVVGAGMSGMCMAAKLRDAGYDNVIVLEKADEVGGTWRENHYPGLTCDVPSRFYSYSFAPNPSWSRVMAPGPEILEYFKKIADDLDLRRLVRFGSEVTDARWNGKQWRIETADGYFTEADVLITATGFLHHPKLPDIDGLEKFGGIAMHSAQWDDSVELAGKRIGVIGTGSTGAQITTALSKVAAHLSVFQRTPQWVLPVPNHEYSPLSKMAFEHVPYLNRTAQVGYRALMEYTLGEAVVREGWQRNIMSALCRANLKYGIKDPQLRAKVTPDYKPLCKRIVISSGLYPALQQDNVEVITDRIDHIEERGVVTADGTLHELDILALATGFDAHAYMRPMRVTGEDELTLDEAWAKGPRAYETVAMPGFPNFFMVVGPHSPVGNQSIIGVAETQTRYIMQWIEKLGTGRIAKVTPKPEATDRFNEAMRAELPNTIAASGCSSWYLGADGLPEIWPWTPGDHRAMLRTVKDDDFEVTPTG